MYFPALYTEGPESRDKLIAMSKSDTKSLAHSIGTGKSQNEFAKSQCCRNHEMLQNNDANMPKGHRTQLDWAPTGHPGAI